MTKKMTKITKTKKIVFSNPVKRKTMSEQMAETIKGLILSGELNGGDVLPTEPELSTQFGVSRAVVRDATRILMALGLVEVKHGSGVYVTKSQSDAFGEALLIALTRSGATAWDVEHFQQIMFPELIALAATTATDEEIGEIREHIERYEQIMLDVHIRNSEANTEEADSQTLLTVSQQIIEAIFEATHNRVFQELARPLVRLRNLRNWEVDENDTPENLVEIEMLYFNGLLDAIESRDPVFARQWVGKLMSLPPTAIAVMKQTPVGERPKIPLLFSALKKHLEANS
ncbi:MAG: DNA-binding FadR family transcriptional regulator [Cellvibrionaceae bacterium]|jgi:DNA-binding FadR family transcriptional regulator